MQRLEPPRAGRRSASNGIPSLTMSAHSWFAFFLSMPVSLWVGVIVAVASVNFWHLPLYHSVFIGNAAGVVCWLVLFMLPPYFFRSG